MTKTEAEAAVAEHLFRALCLIDAYRLERDPSLRKYDLAAPVVKALKGNASMLVTWACLLYPVK